MISEFGCSTHLGRIFILVANIFFCLLCCVLKLENWVCPKQEEYCLMILSGHWVQARDFEILLHLDMLPLFRLRHIMVMCRVLLRNEMWLCLCCHLEMKCCYIQFSCGHGEFMPLLFENSAFWVWYGYCYRRFESRPNYDDQSN